MQTYFSYTDDFSREDYNQYINNFPKTEYVGSEFGNTTLHILAAMLLNKTKEEKITTLNRILNSGNVNINQVNTLKSRTFLMVACKYSNYDIVEYMLDNFGSLINFSLEDSSELSLLAWLFLKDQKNLALKAIKCGATVLKKDLMSVKDSDYRNKISMIFFDRVIPYQYNELDEEKYQHSDFKIYRKEDFIFGQNTKLGSGSYGVATVVVDRTTGKKIVLKKFTENMNTDLHFLMDENIIRDIVYLRELKRKKHAVQIYGIFVDDFNYVYMVMEFLEKTTTEQLYLISNIIGMSSRIKQYKRALYEALICINENSKAGFIHCDTKENNTMIDTKGRLRIIDYGFSYFLGICDDILNSNHSIHIGTYLAQDGTDEGNTFIYYNSDTNREMFRFKSGNLTFNLDIPSIAMMFISCCINIKGKDQGYVTHGGNFYIKVKRVQNLMSISTFEAQELQDGRNKLELYFGKELANILFDMLEVDNSIRKTAKEFISDPYFHDEVYHYPKDLELTTLVNTEKPRTIENRFFNNSNIITSSNYVRTGFVYYDDIINYWSSKNIRYINRSVFSRYTFKEVILYLNSVQYSLNTYIGTFLYLNSISNRIINGLPCPFTQEDIDRNKLLPFVIATSISRLYDRHIETPEDLLSEISDLKDSNTSNFLWFNKIPYNKDNVYAQEILAMTNKIKRDIDFFTMNPVNLYINYIKFILQVVCKDNDRIIKLIKTLSKNLILHFYKEVGEVDVSVKKINLFDLIKHLYYQLDDYVEINLRPTGVY